MVGARWPNKNGLGRHWREGDIDRYMEVGSSGVKVYYQQPSTYLPTYMYAWDHIDPFPVLEDQQQGLLGANWHAAPLIDT